jgi:hypothetical protein
MDNKVILSSDGIGIPGGSALVNFRFVQGFIFPNNQKQENLVGGHDDDDAVLVDVSMLLTRLLHVEDMVSKDQME